MFPRARPEASLHLQLATARCWGSPKGSMNRSAWPLSVLFCLGALPALTGCGSLYYGIIAGAAGSKLDEAKELGADRYAAYEYTLARARLRHAYRVAGESAYGDAAELAESAEDLAEKAVELTRERRHLPGAKAAEKETEGAEGKEPEAKEGEP